MADPAIALGIKTPDINTMQNYEAAKTNAVAVQGAKQQQEVQALQQIAEMGLGVKGGKIDGPVDPVRAQQAIALMPNNPLAAQLTNNPALWDTITKGSISVLQFSQNQQQFELAKQQFQRELESTNADINLKNAQAGMYARGGPNSGSPIQDANGNYYIAHEYSDKLTPMTTAGAGPASPTAAPIDAAPATGGTPTGGPAAPAGAAAPMAPAGGAPATGSPQFLTPAEQEAAKAKASKDAEIKAALPQQMVAAKTSLEQLDQSDKLVSDFIDQAIKKADNLSTGWVGKTTESMAGTPSYELSKTLDTIRANVGFDKLAAMRAASPSGGALGQVSNFEEQLLQSVLGSLDQGQSKEQLVDNLKRLKDFISSNHAQREAAFKADFGGVTPLSGDKNFNADSPSSPPPPPPPLGNAASTAGSAGTPAAPKAGDIQDGYRFKGGDPSDQRNWDAVN